MVTMIARLFLLLCFVGSFNCETPHDLGIVGGHKITIEHVPFMVSLRIDGTHHWCGGSIIHERFILTAAHCIILNRTYKVLVGTASANGKTGGSGKLYDVEKIIRHRKYSNETFVFDVSLIKLATPLKFGRKVASISLADHNIRLPMNTMLNVTGWGSTGFNRAASTKLQQVLIPIVSRYQCKLLYAKQHINIAPQMICAGKKGADSCQGDSGGPLTKGNVQVGVTSFGIGCGVAPGVYTKISTVLRWINRNILQNL